MSLAECVDFLLVFGFESLFFRCLPRLDAPLRGFRLRRSAIYPEQGDPYLSGTYRAERPRQGAAAIEQYIHTHPLKFLEIG